MLPIFPGLIFFILLMIILFWQKDSAYQGDRLLITILLIAFFGVYISGITFYSSGLNAGFLASPFISGVIGLCFFLITLISVKNKVPLKQVVLITMIIIGSSIVSSLFKTTSGSFHIIDGIIILMVLYVTSIKRLKSYLIYQKYLIGLDSILLSLSLFLLLFFLGYRKVNIGAKLIYDPGMLLTILILAALWISIGLFVAIKSKFISFVGLKKINLRYVLIMSVYMIFMSLNEEIIYRGYIFNYFKQLMADWNIIIPLALSTIVFGFSHFFSGGLVYCGLSILAGLFYGVTYVITGNIFYATFIHSLTNIIQNLFFIMKGESIPDSK